MALGSIFKRKNTAAAPASVLPEPGLDEGAPVQAARTRARRRLIGAVVLLAAGIVGFPLLFETQPRPLHGDVPIELARRDGSVAAPGARGAGVVQPTAVAPGPSAEPAAPHAPPATGAAAPEPAPTPESVVATVRGNAAPDAPAVGSRAPSPAEPSTPSKATEKPAPAPTPAPVPKPEPKPDAKPSPKAEQKGEQKPDQKLDQKAEQKVAPKVERAAEPKPAERPAAPAAAKAPVTAAADATPPPAAGRFVVQVGAYKDAVTVRETRAKLEKLGYRTYTQQVDAADGARTRVRVGPYATRDEAERAARVLEGAGFPGNLLSL